MIFHSVARASKKGQSTPGELKSAKYSYFAAMKKGKHSHWNNFTDNANQKQLWAANRLKKPKDADNLPSFPNTTNTYELNVAHVDHFFPPRNALPTPTPHPYRDAPAITAEEIGVVLAESSAKSTPGPNTIWRFH